MKNALRSISYLRLAKKEIYPIVYRCHELEARAGGANEVCSEKLNDAVALKAALESAAEYVDATFSEWGGDVRRRSNYLARRLRVLAEDVDKVCATRRPLKRGRVARFLQHLTRFFNSLAGGRVA